MDFSSATYASCRQAFRELAASQGAKQFCWPVDPAADLTIDVAVFGSPNAAQTFVVSSGLHGAEAVFGSYLQQRWMSQAVPRLAGANCLIMLHALNPFGFAHGRRGDANNVDLNRAFFDSTERPPPAGLYRRLNPLLNPAGPPRRDGFPLRALLVLARYGAARVTRAIAEGQYAYPQGMFYGGQQTTRLQQILETEFLPLIKASSRVEHFDIHTGLGPFGKLELLKSVQASGSATTIPYTPKGMMGDWLEQHAARREQAYRYWCAEVGTYSSLRVLSALRDENRAWFAAGPDSPAHRRAAERLRERFQPRDPEWKTQATEQTLAALENAMIAESTLP